jgi:hypothetical protein
MRALSKTCLVCGREFQWRKKWHKNWHQVKYCSSACRRAGLTDIDLELEKVIVKILQSRQKGASICPSEAARAMAQDDVEQQWRPLMEPTRRAARRLVHQGKICILQGGKIVDPSKFKGPVRLKLKR